MEILWEEEGFRFGFKRWQGLSSLSSLCENKEVSGSRLLLNKWTKTKTCQPFCFECWNPCEAVTEWTRFRELRKVLVWHFLCHWKLHFTSKHIDFCAHFDNHHVLQSPAIKFSALGRRYGGVAVFTDKLSMPFVAPIECSYDNMIRVRYQKLPFDWTEISTAVFVFRLWYESSFTDRLPGTAVFTIWRMFFSIYTRLEKMLV